MLLVHFFFVKILKRMMEIIDKENVPYTDDGLEAIIFTAQGDMRQVCYVI